MSVPGSPLPEGQSKRKPWILVSLRGRVAIGVAFPLLVILLIFSWLHYWREFQLLEQQIELTAQQLGEVTLGSLQHAMLINDHALIEEVVANVGKMENILLIQVINEKGETHHLAGKTSVNTDTSNPGRKENSEGCRICHQITAANRPRTTHLTIDNSTLRIITPINNDSQCQVCHSPTMKHLGVLLLDVSLVNARSQIWRDISLDLVISLVGVIVIASGIFLLIHFLVVKRVEAFRTPLQLIAAGQLDTRLAVSNPPSDELDELASGFNRVVESLEEHSKQQEERNKVRQKAIAEERDRIARELHDGLSQVLSYVIHKTDAIRLHLQKSNPSAAEQQLAQLEAAAQELYTDTREAITGLKIGSNDIHGFGEALEVYVHRFSHLSGLPVNLDLPPNLNQFSIKFEPELQLLRIIQEALTNIRKHARANQVSIRSILNENELVIIVEDDGIGFETVQSQADWNEHFGLQSMQERAAAIDAKLEINSTPGKGTCIKIHYKFQPGKLS